MNKDVIYVEPEDDITDIILKIENAKEKIVALVPPKKAGVFRSVVNIKLIAKSSVAASKKVVLVTTDPSIVKLAAAAKIPVTKNLQSAPSIPEVEVDASNMIKEDLVEESDGTVEVENDIDEAENSDSEKKAEPDAKNESPETDNEEEEEKGGSEKKTNERLKKTNKKALSNNKIVTWIADHKKLTVAGGIGIVAIILFLVWALVIAPAVAITVGVKTELRNFSQNVSFTTKLEEENTETGVFYLDEKKAETPSEVTFEATGKKNVGQRATGELVAYVYFSAKGSFPINAGTEFTINDLTFVADADSSLTWNGHQSSCENNNNKDDPIIRDGGVSCLKSGRIKVTAAEPGAKYNIAKSSAGWHTISRIAVYSDDAMGGGTDEEITVVQQSDIDKAKEQLVTGDTSRNKEKLDDLITDDMIPISSSLNQSTSEVISTPAVGEEVKEGVKPTLKSITTASIFVIDKTKVEEFITKKAELNDAQKIYEMKNPFVENFLKNDGGIAGKIKTSYLVGPELSVSSITELIRGKGIGDARYLLEDISGVSVQRIEGSFPWVTSVPDDTNRITVKLEVKDQSGNSIEQSDKQQNDGESGPKNDKESQDSEAKN